MESTDERRLLLDIIETQREYEKMASSTYGPLLISLLETGERVLDEVHFSTGEANQSSLPRTQQPQGLIATPHVMPKVIMLRQIMNSPDHSRRTR